MNIGRVLSEEIKKTYCKLVFGSTQKLKFEDRLILSTCFVVSIASAFISCFNYYIELEPEMLYVTVILAIVFGIYFLYSRFLQLNKILYLLVSITVVVFLNCGWYFNCGSRSSILSLFIIIYGFLIFVWDKKKIVLISVGLIINLFILFILELNNPNIVGSYNSELARVSDVYVDILLSLVLMMIFSLTIKNNYIKEHHEARKVEQLKSAFLANMSHEIRTPLNAIVGFSSLLADGDFNQKQRTEFREIINDNSEYLLFLIEDIIDLSKIDVDGVVLRNGKVDLSVLFERLKNHFEKNLSEEISINYELDIEDTLIETDAMRLEQILRSLIDNAVKFTNKGSVIFSCKQLGHELTFQIKDTGIGIRTENLEKIFERFVKIDENIEILARGTGIGLFLSKQLVNKLGGRIWVYSELGVGSSFHFSINTSTSDK